MGKIIGFKKNTTNQREIKISDSKNNLSNLSHGTKMKIKNTIKKLIFTLPEPVVRKVYDINNVLFHPDAKEEKHHYGPDNPNQIFYVIRPRPKTVEGLMGLFLYVIQQIDYAEMKGYYPVVDFQNYNTQYSTKANTNDWEAFFKPISTKTLAEVYNSRNVVLSGTDAVYSCNRGLKDHSIKYDDLDYANKIIKKYISFSEIVLKRYRKEYERIRPDVCIGLYLRGTDYIKLKPTGEPVQPEPKEAIEYIDKNFNSSQFERIFLVTEDENVYKIIKQAYGDKVITVSFDSYIRSYDSSDFLANSAALNELNDDPHERGINYLVKIMLLSNCKYIVGGLTCGSWAACAISGKKDNIFIFDKGKY